MARADQLAEQASVLRGLGEAAQAVSAATHHRDEAMRGARDAGATVDAIAEASGLSTATVYRILGRSPELPPRQDWSRILNDALLITTEHGASMAEAQRGISSGDDKAKARRLQLGAKNMVSKPRVGSVEWTTLAAGMAIAASVLRN